MGFVVHAQYIMYLFTYSYSSNDINPGKVSEAEKARAPGFHMGLTVLVDPQPEDYYYPLLAAYGTKVKNCWLSLYQPTNALNKMHNIIQMTECYS